MNAGLSTVKLLLVVSVAWQVLGLVCSSFNGVHECGTTSRLLQLMYPGDSGAPWRTDHVLQLSWMFTRLQYQLSCSLSHQHNQQSHSTATNQQRLQLTNDRQTRLFLVQQEAQLLLRDRASAADYTVNKLSAVEEVKHFEIFILQIFIFQKFRKKLKSRSVIMQGHQNWQHSGFILMSQSNFFSINALFFKIFAFEKYHKLETWHSSHSTSLKMTPFDRLLRTIQHTVSQKKHATTFSTKLEQ